MVEVVGLGDSRLGVWENECLKEEEGEAEKADGAATAHGAELQRIFWTNSNPAIVAPTHIT